MNKISFTIDGKEIICKEGDTILKAAADNGIEIPSLCHDGRLSPFGACGVCVVEAENSPKLLRACSTAAAAGQTIKTDTTRVLAARQSALELMLSDHKGDCIAPCRLACPAHTDCQGYAAMIAHGENEKATERVLEKVPLPGSIGRICPHPCESKCRRSLVEEPVSLAALKVFAAEHAAALTMPTIKAETGKRVSVVGGGPGGLTAAYFLRLQGHGVTVYDANDKMGGMLRYGVPEYRLPKTVLGKEIDFIKSMGVRFVNNYRIGKDISFSELQKNSDAVILAIGAWNSIKLGCKGEHLNRVIGGIDFLSEVSPYGQDSADSPYTKVIKGKKVAVIGGGDTAMDACRTALRLGADTVYNIYRRTVKEMPANEIEIAEAQEEGVVFKSLCDPVEILGGDSVTHIRLQKMALGEPDASGRRAPVAVEGAQELLPVDTVIVMIGQSVDTGGFSDIVLSKKGTIAADECTYATNLTGVFAIGDATNKGAGLAIEAIGEAGRCAKIVHGYLSTGAVVPLKEEFKVTDTKTAEDFIHRKKEKRNSFSVRPAAERKHDFIEVNAALSNEQAIKEASRCLECGCAGFNKCKLYRFSDQFGLSVKKYGKPLHAYKIDDSAPHLVRDMNKCVLCGMCVRICEAEGAGVLGFVNRGFETVIQPEYGKPLAETNCIRCGRCAQICPTGAIVEKVDG